jgi:uncharacterized HhH-GPD family protein
LLLKHGRALQRHEDEWDTGKFSNVEFFYGALFDQGIRADLAWEAPRELRKRLGHLDPRKIARMNESRLRRTMRYPKALHRYRRKMPNWVIESSKLLVERYGGKPSRIWGDNPRADDLQRRFDEFKGIDQKKASMATNIPVRDKGVKVKGVDWRGIDISSDFHVRRVFLRTGLIDDDSVDALVEAARGLNPKYPGELDLPSWYIGSKFCHPRFPECPKCPLSADRLKGALFERAESKDRASGFAEG